MSDLSRPDSPDRALLDRAVAGDHEAFADIYRRYHQVVYRFGCAMTGSEPAAEDITQEAFVALFRELARYDPDRASFTTYLYGIVRNLSRERLRRERRFLSLEVLGPGSEASYTADPTGPMENAELASQVRRALRRLPARYRELIVLCDLHGLSYADTAVVVNISVAAVRSRLHRGRQILRRQLSGVARPEPRRARHPERCAI
jgi:RNA polymerase sigma-70 factor (ECF subfamily)